jgi:hypothetical protein
VTCSASEDRRRNCAGIEQSGFAGGLMREQVMLVVEQHINAGRHNDAEANGL